MEPPRTLRVLSYNIHGQAHRLDRRYLERVARVVTDLAPDVVGMQEVHRGGWRARGADQAAALGDLTGMAVAYGPSYRENGGERGGEFGNAVLTAGVIREAEVVPLPAPGEPRTLLRTRIALSRQGDLELSFYVTHLAAWGRWGRPARSLQTAALLARLRQSSGPLVLVGDLNAEPHSPELRPLLAGEVFRMCGDALVGTHRVMRQRIDYVFADPGWTTTSERVVQAGPSDHWPVLVELERRS